MLERKQQKLIVLPNSLLINQSSNHIFLKKYNKVYKETKPQWNTCHHVAFSFTFTIVYNLPVFSSPLPEVFFSVFMHSLCVCLFIILNNNSL